jgi:hypothetical protein
MGLGGNDVYYRAFLVSSRQIHLTIDRLASHFLFTCKVNGTLGSNASQH